MRHMDPHPSLRAELAVQMLVSLLVNDRKVVVPCTVIWHSHVLTPLRLLKVGIAAADSMETPLYIAASIRCQRGQVCSNL